LPPQIFLSGPLALSRIFALLHRRRFSACTRLGSSARAPPLRLSSSAPPAPRPRAPPTLERRRSSRAACPPSQQRACARRRGLSAAGLSSSIPIPAPLPQLESKHGQARELHAGLQRREEQGAAAGGLPGPSRRREEAQLVFPGQIEVDRGPIERVAAVAGRRQTGGAAPARFGGGTGRGGGGGLEAGGEGARPAAPLRREEEQGSPASAEATTGPGGAPLLGTMEDLPHQRRMCDGGTWRSSPTREGCAAAGRRCLPSLLRRAGGPAVAEEQRRRGLLPAASEGPLFSAEALQVGEVARRPRRRCSTPAALFGPGPIGAGGGWRRSSAARSSIRRSGQRRRSAAAGSSIRGGSSPAARGAGAAAASSRGPERRRAAAPPAAVGSSRRGGPHLPRPPPVAADRCRPSVPPIALGRWEGARCVGPIRRGQVACGRARLWLYRVEGPLGILPSGLPPPLQAKKCQAALHARPRGGYRVGCRSRCGQPYSSIRVSPFM
ncbi:unnamed protein product, partial [Urochloa humidicola]